MGDVSIIARRLEDGHVQYGWSGNGGYYKVVILMIGFLLKQMKRILKLQILL